MTTARTEQPAPDYVPGHALLEGRTVVVTAAAGAGIGSAVVRRCLEEGARAVVLGDTHERRLDEARASLGAEFGADRVAAVLREWSARTGVRTRLRSCGSPLPLLVTARHETLAVLREALANVDRHAAARTVDVELAAEDGYLVLTVRDDGRGFDPEAPVPGHYGLVGMRERAVRAGGRLALDTAPGRGTALTLRVPLAAPSDTSERSP